jgi:hypothetical protein
LDYYSTHAGKSQGQGGISGLKTRTQPEKLRRPKGTKQSKSSSTYTPEPATQTSNKADKEQLPKTTKEKKEEQEER